MGIWTVTISCHFLVKVQVKFASAHSSPRCLFLGTMRHIGKKPSVSISFPYLLLATSEITEIKKKSLLLMAEILHQLRLLVYPIIYRALYISGGSLGFQPSTVVHLVLPVQVLWTCAFVVGCFIPLENLPSLIHAAPGTFDRICLVVLLERSWQKVGFKYLEVTGLCI